MNDNATNPGRSAFGSGPPEDAGTAWLRANDPEWSPPEYWAPAEAPGLNYSPRLEAQSSLPASFTADAGTDFQVLRDGIPSSVITTCQSCGDELMATVAETCDFADRTESQPSRVVVRAMPAGLPMVHRAGDLELRPTWSVRPGAPLDPDSTGCRCNGCRTRVRALFKNGRPRTYCDKADCQRARKRDAARKRRAKARVTETA